ncbi:hypothetical protein TOPH_09107 [Tolypocladium ophioglossoides CBS 100239]|uniref:Uncharacterized protein n=1 Tax=Tolypocladium ophioglossoides (strain CBS 100239) TaxID=1163406 RepID=A0A0L0MWH3_TOLOC|nr:hypothetical protein TOPH_09107 [Tolypocladium ophioglossoides CBS 100239]
MPNLLTICSLATSVIGSPCYFILEIENKAFSGREYLVYPLESALKSRIYVRIPKESINPYISLLIKREANIHRPAYCFRFYNRKPATHTYPSPWSYRFRLGGICSASVRSGIPLFPYLRARKGSRLRLDETQY